MRSWQDALAYAKAQSVTPSRDWSDMCQMFSRSCVGAAAWAASAREAFNATPVAHRHTGVPPLGALAYYGESSSGQGHAVFSCGDGYVYSTDILRRGKVDRVPYLIFEKAWGLPYRGWIDSTPSGAIDIYVKPIIPPAAPYPGKPIGWPSLRSCSTGAPVASIQRSLRVPVTSMFNMATRDAIAKWTLTHPAAALRDRVGLGAAGPALYASILTRYPRD